MKPKLDEIVYRAYDLEPGDEEFISDERLQSLAESRGWDASDAAIFGVEPHMLGQLFNSNCARKKVDEPCEMGHPAFISCLVLDDEEIWR